MKKIIIAMAAIAAAFTMASCNKEQPVSPNENPTVGKSVITASINNDLTKTTLEGNDTDGYKVFWSEGDKLVVFDSDEFWGAEYTLDKSSAGSSKGTFIWQEGDYFDSEDGYDEPKFEKDHTYGAVYPYDLFYEHSEYIWKTEQTYTDTYIPMFGEAKCTEEGVADFTFTNLGGLLRLNVKGTATIKSITVQANEPMSGHILDIFCEDDEGYKVAFISDWAVLFTPNTKNYITLDCGTSGVALSEEGTDFYISMPCRYNANGEEMADFDGYSKVTITLTDIDGKTCVKKLSNDKKLVIERSKITTASFTASDFKANIPEGALPGKFTINEDGDQVYFSQGNLYWDGDSFEFETNQYDYPTTWSASHVGHLYWSKNASVAYAESYSESGTSTSDVLFTNATAETAKSDFTVNGVTGKYRALSMDEWTYLFNNHVKKWITVCGIKGYALAPDRVSADDISNSYPDDAAWKTAQDAGMIFLPVAGFRDGSSFGDDGGYGYYWSSSASTSSTSKAYRARFYSVDVTLDQISDGRINGESVRLVTDCE